MKKTTDDAHAAAADTPRPFALSVEQRLAVIRRSAILAEAALVTSRARFGDKAYEDSDYIEAAISMVIEVHEQAYWLEQIPADVLNVPAPDGDQIERAKKGGAR